MLIGQHAKWTSLLRLVGQLNDTKCRFPGVFVWRSKLAEPTDRVRPAPCAQRREPARPLQTSGLRPVPSLVAVPPLPPRRVPRTPLPPIGPGRSAPAAAVPTFSGRQTSQMLAPRRRGIRICHK